MNVAKSREMMMDFRKKRVATQPLNILGEDMEAVEDYEYLGVHIDSKLNWKSNSEAGSKKGIYFRGRDPLAWKPDVALLMSASGS